MSVWMAAEAAFLTLRKQLRATPEQHRAQDNPQLVAFVTGEEMVSVFLAQSPEYEVAREHLLNGYKHTSTALDAQRWEGLVLNNQ